MAWHVSGPEWEAYAAGALRPFEVASVESHVIECPDCQSAARRYSSPSESIWDSVRETINTPELSLPLRLLRRLGVSAEDLTIIGASDSLTLSWAVAVGGALTAVLATALAGIRQEFSFMLLVPLVQVLSVMASFDATDSLREVATPTPLGKLRVSLLRSAMALAIAVPATMAVGLAIPDVDSMAFAWLLPSLGLVLAALVLHTWIDARLATVAVACGWVVIAALAYSQLSTATAQLVSAAVAASLAVALVLRTNVFRLGSPI